MILNLAFLAREEGDRFVWDIEDTESSRLRASI